MTTVINAGGTITTAAKGDLIERLVQPNRANAGTRPKAFPTFPGVSGENRDGGDLLSAQQEGDVRRTPQRCKWPASANHW